MMGGEILPPPTWNRVKERKRATTIDVEIFGSNMEKKQ